MATLTTVITLATVAAVLSSSLTLASTTQDPDVITIDRDTYGIPHIYATTAADAAFGFGYAQAEDHLDLMLRNYMEATGRLAELDGDAAIETDSWTRLWRIPEQSQASYPKLNPSTRAYLDSFVAGINQYMDTHPDAVPPWAERVTPIAVIALYRLLHVRLNDWTMPELPAVNAMSNHWAIAPKKTANGTTLCVMDPHLPWTPYFRMYEAHLVSEDGLNIYGATTLGMPTIILGHNGRIAWSFTINACDVSDVYEEQLDPQNHRRYRYEREWRTIQTRDTIIRAKTDSGFRNESRTLSWTHHGPMFRTVGDTAYAIRLSAFDIADPMTQLLRMARARHLDEFKTTLASIDIPMFNILYGDADGNLYYLFNERCPTRSAQYDWRKPVPGWTRETEWGAYLPLERLPQTENPTSGFLQNCNTAPWFVTPESGIRQEDYPSYAAGGILTGRSRRLLAWLQGHHSITVEQTLALAMDEYNLTAEDLKPLILQSYTNHWRTTHDPDGHIARAVNLLREWDNTGSAESLGMTVFALWKLEYDALLQAQSARADMPQEHREVMTVTALRRAVEYMINHYGRVDVPWGRIHVLRRGDREFPVGGSSPGTESIRPVRGALSTDGKMIADFGSVFTMVVELGRTVRAWSLVPFGSSEHPESPHYDDQVPLWTGKRFKQAWFTREEVTAHRERQTVLKR